MDQRLITIEDIKRIAPFSQGSTEIFLTGHWSSRKPLYIEKTSSCRQSCPIGNDIARAFQQASLGNFDEALRIFRQDNPLPGVCGRVCYHPCETGCNRKDFDEPVNIRGFERFLSEHGKVDLKREAPVRARKEKIAVIGSGPAGLAASYHLSRLGYPVTIFEALPEPGGMLRYGIPEYRLPKEVLRREIGYIQEMGVDIRSGVRVGKDLSLNEIRRDYRALFIAVGAHRGVRLGIEGEDLAGVMEGMHFLRSVGLGEKVDPGKRVAVIGGGNTAVDCARTAIRIGGEDVSIVYRRSLTEMPAIAEDIVAMEREGVKIHILSMPKRFIKKDGRLSALECVRMELGEADSSGRARPVPIEGSEFTLEVDTVILAAGQVPETEFCADLGLTLSGAGVIEVRPGSVATNVEGVFAGGDGAGEKAFVADAIASGKRGALAISCYLEGRDFEQELDRCRIGDRSSLSFQRLIDKENYPVDLGRIVTPDKVNTLCFKHAPRSDNPHLLEPEESTKGFSEVIGGVDGISSEIERCFKCGTCTQCDLCFLLCPDISVQKSSTGYSIRKDYCKGCGQCASTCPRNVIEMGVNQ